MDEAQVRGGDLIDHNVLVRIAALIGVLALGRVDSCVAQSAEHWWLMSRHGECVEIASLKRKVPELGEVADPAAFVQLMQKLGFAVDSQEVGGATGRVVTVNVPRRELSLIFATAPRCGTFVKR